MTFVRALIVFLCLLVASAPPVIAQKMTPKEMESVQTALNRGQLLYAYDQAAWHATDAMLADAEKRGLTKALPQMLGGWVVIGSVGNPKVIFFDKNENSPRAVYRVELAESGTRVISTHFVDDEQDATIEEGASELIHARKLGVSSIVGAELLRCAKGAWNTIVLPPDRSDGPFLVYLLSPQDTLDVAPAGGHYRVEVTASGKTGPVHAFSKSCLDVPTSQANHKPVGLVVTQLLDPVPTEISVFTMFVAQLPLYVLTIANTKTWMVGAIKGQAYIEVLPDKSKDALPDHN